ncbi:MAG: matrixin family metalloprotease [Halolamina sp.]
MSRLALLVVGVLVVVAGCAAGPDAGGSPAASTSDATATPTVTGSPSPTATSPVVDPDNPWRERTLIVAVADAGGVDSTTMAAIRAAADWWTENASDYAGYPVAFVVDANASDPDVVVEVVANVSDCGHAGDAVGCAPLVTDAPAPRPATVSIQDGLSGESTRRVLEHEFGHLLGLDHDDDPASVMAAEAAVTTTPRPNATERAFPWADAAFTVYVDPGDADPEAFRSQVDHALTYYADGAPGMPDNLTFEVVTNRSAADVVVVAGDACGRPGSCVRATGVDPDGDDAVEEYRRLRITIQGLDTDAVGWHVGNWLAYGLGAEAERERPPPFRNATAAERRSDWWAD